MRFTKKKIEDLLQSVVGIEGMPLINQLAERDNISEFELATKTKKDIKVIRKQLYILYNNNLVSFTRKKDKQKGWYIYYWTILPESIKYLYFKKKREYILQLKGRLETEQKELFFACPTSCVRLTFDQATDFEFHCPECGKLVSQDSSEEKTQKIKGELKALEGELREDEKITVRKKTKGTKTIKAKPKKVKKKK